MDKGDVVAFVERAEEAIDAAAEMGVRNTQLRIVEPFLSLLDWDVRSPDVEAAYVTPTGEVVDYALVPDETPGAFVRVTGADDELRSSDAVDLVEAMRAADVERGLLTNGRAFWLLAVDTTRPTEEVDPSSDATRLGSESVEEVRVDLASLPEHVTAVAALSKDAVSTLRTGERQRAAAALVAADEDAVDAVTSAVADVTGEDVEADVEPLARRFLGAVVDELAPKGFRDDPTVLEDGENSGGSKPEASSAGDAAGSTSSEARSAAAKDEPATERSSQTTAEPESAGPPPTVRDPSKPVDGSASSDDAESEYVVRFFDSSRSVGAVGNPDVDSAMSQAVEYMLQERGLGPRLQFPYTPDGEGTAFLHREPVHPDGREMRSVRDLGGLYLYTGQDVESKQEQLETLAERSGLRVMFSGDWS